MKLLLILVLKIVKTIKVFCIIEGFLDILDDFGSDATPMTPCTVVGTLDFRCLQETIEGRRIQRAFAFDIN